MKKTVAVFIGILLFPLLIYSTEMSSVKNPKSSTQGVLLSIGSTVIPIGIGSLIYSMAESNNNNAFMWCGGLLAFSGATIGPDAGHFYAQQWSRGRERAGIRFTIGLALGLSTIYLIGSAGAAGVGAEINQAEYDIAMGAMIASGCAYLIYTIWDIATVPSSIREYNNSIKGTSELHIIPHFDVNRQICGLILVYTF